MGSLYGFEVESALPLRRLNVARGTRGTLTIEMGELPAPDNEPVSALVDARGRCWYAAYELDGGDFLLELAPTGSFLLEPEAGRVAVTRTAEDDDLLEHRIASSAICTLLALRGDLALHAAAVEIEGHAVVFCGPTQRGKSTLARTLGETGHPLLGEDGIAIELADGRAIAYPGARGVRVRGNAVDGAFTELLSDPGPAEPSPCPVVAVVLLGERGAAIEVEQLEAARAMALLTPSLIHAGSRPTIAAAFARLAGLLRVAPAFTAKLPDDLAALPAASSSLLDKVGQRS